MRTIRRWVALAAVAAAGLGFVCAPASAADAYPAHPVTLVVAYPPGGASDVVGRLVAQKLSDALGQQFVIDNRAGAGGNLGARYVSAAKPDGYTILLGAVTALSVNATLTPDTAHFNLEKDFAPVAMIGSVPLLLVVNNDLPVKTFADFIALAKAKPNSINFASAGIGTTQHLGGELFKLMTKTELVHVPYKGSGPAVTDVIGGQVQSTFETGPSVVSFVKAGKLRLLAVATPQRMENLPDAPTASEAGLPGYEVSATYGLLAPAGTPKEIVDRLSAEVKKIVAMPDVKQRFQDLGVISMYMTPAETTVRIHEEIAKWARVIKEANVKAE
jgi:tripartite-type tricarboxylate transporter receptor subunit TctC